MRAAHPENDFHGPKEYHDITEERPAADVLGLERNHLLEVGDLIPPPHLPWSGDPRFYIEAGIVVRLVELNFRWDGRPRTDQRHLARQNIKELRKLIETRATQPRTESRNTRIPQNLEEAEIRVDALLHQLIAPLLGSEHHCPELEDLELASAAANAVLAEEHRPLRVQLHERSNEQKKRCRQNETETRSNQIEGALDDQLSTTQSGCSELD